MGGFEHTGVTRMLEVVHRVRKEIAMGYATAREGTSIFYKDWGLGRPVVFSHGWPLNGDAWDPQLLHDFIKS